MRQVPAFDAALCVLVKGGSPVHGVHPCFTLNRPAAAGLPHPLAPAASRAPVDGRTTQLRIADQAATPSRCRCGGARPRRQHRNRATITQGRAPIGSPRRGEGV
jgi:hypothetical protein